MQKMRLLTKFMAIPLLSVMSVQAFEGAASFSPPLEDVFEDIFSGDDASKDKKIEKDENLSASSMRYVAAYFQKILPHVGKNFVNISSGKGKLVFGIYLEGSSFDKCVGLETSSAKVKVAQRASESLKKDFGPLMDKKRELSFKNEDVLKANLNEFNAVFVSCLEFSKSQMEKVGEKLEKELPTGAIIMSTQALPSRKGGSLKLLEETSLRTNQNERVAVTVYEKTSGKGA